ncbi:MAG: hypothetical protein RR633_18220, partial [Acinetobacter sp.]
MKNMNVQNHPLQGEKKVMQKLKVSTLAASITLLIAQSASTYASDIEIYTKPSSTASSGVVVMMLDTSGSMDVSNAGTSACDLPEGLSSSRTISSSDLTENGYKKRYCYFGSGADLPIYYYYKQNQKWYSCLKGTTNNSSSCFSELTTIPSITGFVKSISGSKEFYSKTASRNTTKYYDRISRLKDALYTLAIMPVYDETTKVGIKADVKIGIGTFPYVGDGENNRRGYIRIPAAAWGAVGSSQRTKVLNLIKSSSFIGNGGTPTSAAYAEAAAYLLGTTTGGGEYSGINLSKAADSSLVSGSNYVTPLDKSAGAAECSGQGIYFLTDGQPQTLETSNTSSLMKNALRMSVNYTFSTGLSGGSNDGVNLGNGWYPVWVKSDWRAIGSFAKSLNDPEIIKNALNVSEAKREVLTAVVGFGSVFDGTYSSMNQDAKNAYDWGLAEEEAGVYGKGS